MKTKTNTEQLLNLYAKNSKFWKKAVNTLTDVTIKPSKSFKKVDFTGLQPKPNSCFLNALAVCMNNPKVDYVEGFLEVHGVPLEHAWNCFDGKHFDVTMELIKDGASVSHRAIMVVPAIKAMKYAAKLQISGPFLNQWLME